MKTIAVLTDFSARSIHAARYAIMFAQTIKANVLLFNAFLVPSSMPIANALTSWSVNEYGDIKEGAEKELKALCDKLDHELNTQSPKGAFLPEITWQCEEGPIVTTLPLLEKNTNVCLLIAATHGTDALTTFVMGNHCNELVDSVKLPLLLIPEKAPIEYIRNLFFATDLDSADIHYINAVVELVKDFPAHITVVNVGPEIASDKKYLNKIDAFMQQMVSHITYRRVSYENIPVKNVEQGLLKALEEQRPNMLVMIHHKVQGFGAFFRHSATKAMLNQTFLPLLVYSYPQAKAR